MSKEIKTSTKSISKEMKKATPEEECKKLKLINKNASCAVAREIQRLQLITYLPPVKVSPLIKLFRYGFLVAGIIYGLSRQCILDIKEGQIREIELSQKAERDKQLAEEKKRLDEETNKALNDWIAANENTAQRTNDSSERKEYLKSSKK